MKKLIKETIKTIIYLLVGGFVGFYYTLKTINNLVIKGFKKLPRLVKVITIYSLIGLSIVGLIQINQENEIKTITIEKTNVMVVEMFDTREEEKEETSINFSNDNETNIYNKCIEKGLSHNQALLLISISRHETGNWTSKAFTKNNNFGGIMDSDGLRDYNSYEDGLNDFVRILKTYYFDLGFDTIEKIGAKYCPVGAANDPNGLNQYWVGGVTNFYNSYLKDYAK